MGRDTLGRGGGEAGGGAASGRNPFHFTRSVHGAAEQRCIARLWRVHCGAIANTVRPADAFVAAMWQLFEPLLRHLTVVPIAASFLHSPAVEAAMASAVLTGSMSAPATTSPTAPRCTAGEAGSDEADDAEMDLVLSDGSAVRSTTVPVTHVFTLHLHRPRRRTDATSTTTASAVTTSAGTSNAHGAAEEEELFDQRLCLSDEMRAALHEQPVIVLALLEFFAAMLYVEQQLLLRSPPERGDRAREGGRSTVSFDAGVQDSGGASRTIATAAASEETEAKLYATVGRVYGVVLGDAADAVGFEHIGAARLGQLLTLKGTVVRLSPARLVCVAMTYRCDRCGATRRAATPDGVLVFPDRCVGKCRGYRWVAVTAQSRYEEIQQLKLQEHVDFFDASLQDLQGHRASAAAGGGGMNRVVEVELRVPLIDHVTVGDTVCLCGILTCRRGDRKAGGAQQLCLQARSIVSDTNTSGSSMRAMMQPARGGAAATTSNGSPDVGRRCGDGDGGSAAAAALVTPGARGLSVETWSPEESGRFYEMARHPHWFARLAASVAPSLYGLEMVKEALLLSIVGGSTQKLGTRSSIHLLLLGDPGLGKSQLLRAACTVAPRSAYVCAHTSSSCGLTMTLARDPVSGEATFASGAVVHGDGGVTCIDEIDKGISEHKALLEVMEQETVSMAKAGMVFSMPVHTSVLAAGNPIGGRFDLSKSIAANVNLSPALLSRFDVVVCLRDPHMQNSGKLTSHVLQLHRSARSSSPPRATQYEGGAGSNKGNISNGHRQQYNSSSSGVLPHELVRRFIVFCKTQCQPVLRHEACVVLKEHYLHERARYGGGPLSSMELPITPRYLQALIRLAEARAKVELRHEVTREDAQYAVQLVQKCLHTFDGVTGGGGGGGAFGVAAGPPMHATTARKKNQRDYIIDVLKGEIVSAGGVNRLSHKTILAACEAAGCKNPSAMLHQLNEVGLLLQCGDKYSLHGV